MSWSSSERKERIRSQQTSPSRPARCGALARFVALSGIIVGVLRPMPAAGQAFRCADSPNVAVTDLTNSYRGLSPGLYPGARTTPPEEHLAAGVDRAGHHVQPLDESGRPSPDGRVGLLSVGMSNTRSEFAQFLIGARANPAVNRRLVIVNGSLSGADAEMWATPGSRPWLYALGRVADRPDLSRHQVQVIWLKQANMRPEPFPREIERLAGHLEAILEIAADVFPNLEMVFMSSRTRAGAESRRGPGEPHAYESAFAVRQVVQAHMGLGERQAERRPWVGWGPYLWSNGTPRSDGRVWDCGDVQRDMIHPTPSGNEKVADQLMAFFMTAETAIPWFLEPSLSTERAAVTEAVSVAPHGGPAPLNVAVHGEPAGVTALFWSFADGTTSTAGNPTKTFHLPGRYRVRLTAVDDAGRWSTHLWPIDASGRP